MESSRKSSPTLSPEAALPLRSLDASDTPAGPALSVIRSGDRASISSDEPRTVFWTEEEVAMLTKQIKDDTIHWVHLNLFCDWIFQDPNNFTLASRYIRELSLDQSYDTSRIESDSVRRLVNQVISLRPLYEYSVLPPKDETVSLLEILRESATDPNENVTDHRSGAAKLEETQSLPSTRKSFRAPALFTSLRKTSSRLFRKRSPMKAPQHRESARHANQSSSPMPASIQARMELPILSSQPSMRRTPSALMEPLHFQSQPYPPDTPDRPAPLNIKHHPKSSLGNELSRSVSSPARTRAVSPLPPDDTSPPPPVPPIPSPIRSGLRSASGGYPMYPVRRPKKQHRTPLDQDLFKPRGEDTNTRNEHFDSASLQRTSSKGDDSDWLTETDTEDDEAEAQHDDETKPEHESSQHPARHGPQHPSQQNARPEPNRNKVGRVSAARIRASKEAREEARLANLAAMRSADLPGVLGGASVPSGGFVPGGLEDDEVAGGEEEEEEDGEGREGGEGWSEATIALSDFPAAPTTADTYRQVTTRVITDALGRIRARSARMRVVDLATLPYEATAWRNKRAGLLKAIYGRADLELLQVDVEMVERIEGLLEGVRRVWGYEWVQEVFRRAE